MVVEVELQLLIAIVNAVRGQDKDVKAGRGVKAREYYQSCSKLLCWNASKPKISKTAMKI
jgi:hypothetical protein